MESHYGTDIVNDWHWRIIIAWCRQLDANDAQHASYCSQTQLSVRHCTLCMQMQLQLCMWICVNVCASVCDVLTYVCMCICISLVLA